MQLRCPTIDQNGYREGASPDDGERETILRLSRRFVSTSEFDVDSVKSEVGDGDSDDGSSACETD